MIQWQSVNPGQLMDQYHQLDEYTALYCDGIPDVIRVPADVATKLGIQAGPMAVRATVSMACPVCAHVS